ncbi:MAG: hypothetical protein IE927_02235 [Rhodobacterales bacterium]|nr:hypothetical protein [Rhodobacterales bacterium]
MRRAALILGAALGLALAVLWATGALDGLGRLAAEAQRQAQGGLARAIRALRAGEPGAVAALLGLCFAYGVAHAAGPGHGKALVAGYGLGRRVPVGRLAALALAASLAQATTAVALVAGGMALLGWGRERLVATAEDVLDPLAWVAVAALGLWLAARGARGLARGGAQPRGHDHDHGHGPRCGCGHAHAPSPEQAAAVTGWREAAVLVGGIALRPCTGAVFVLILTFGMGLAVWGVLGAYAMALGTASVTAGVAGLAVWSREGVLAGLPRLAPPRVLAALELAAGATVAVTAARLAAGAI